MSVSDASDTGTLASRLAAGETLPPDWYTDRRIHDLEQERIFRRSWQYIGHTGLVAESGDYFTAEVGSIPVVIVRDKQHKLNGFLNICRHRSSVVAEGRGNATTLRCGHHAWTYDLDGTLRGAPHSTMDPEFDRCGLSLVPVRVETSGPFIFVNPQMDATPLDEMLGRLPDLLARRGWKADFYGAPYQRTYDVACNWKINVENAECYHCSVLHPILTASLDTRPPYIKIARHNARFCDFTMRARGVEGEREIDDADTSWVNYFAFPNSWLISRLDDYTLTFATLPLGPDACRLVVEYWFPKTWSDARAADSITLTEEVLGEDFAVLENVQRNQAAFLGGSGKLIGNLEAVVQGFELAVYRAVTASADAAPR
jgi:phenylpropionate dioxygenase-like ring-hydroxylating dioxygenase large terminal subunit